mmetsp:Transcript_30729/g.49948  ORF Transcript_30729/g.49948 Transcript_30729/m.49948 type:complete len:288 (-) Transcript_30729:113-976(-)
MAALTDKIDSLISKLDEFCMSTATVIPSDAFVIVTKWPTKGKCKTRLSKSIGTEMATDFALCALKDLMLYFRELPRQKFILFAPKDAKSNFEALMKELKLAHNEYGLVPMRDSNLCTTNLGYKLAGCVRDLRSAPHRISGRICFVGSDCLELRRHHIDTPRDEDHGKARIIPAVDGGWVLTDMPSHAPCKIFDNVLWSNEKTCESQIAQIQRCGVQVVKDKLTFQDVDEYEDWVKLCSHFGVEWTRNLQEEDDEKEQYDTQYVCTPHTTEYHNHFPFVSALLCNKQI